jgi:hypothetical protein
LPQVRFLGPHYETRSAGKDVVFPRAQWVDVSQKWMDDNRFHMGENFEIEGDEAPTHDDGDGLPDSGWRRPDIITWLDEQGVSLGLGYKTKSALLGIVEQHLNPPAPEPIVEVVEPEVEVVEEIVEEVIEEIVEEPAKEEAEKTEE